AGCPREAPPLGSFADWSKWVRDPLLWLGCVDPVDAMGEVRREDPKLSALAGVLEQWSIVIDDRRVTAREVAEIAGQMAAVGFSHPDLREALLTVAADQHSPPRPMARRKQGSGGRRKADRPVRDGARHRAVAA